MPYCTAALIIAYLRKYVNSGSILLINEKKCLYMEETFINVQITHIFDVNRMTEMANTTEFML